MSERFKVGDRVRLRNYPDRVSTVISRAACDRLRAQHNQSPLHGPRHDDGSAVYLLGGDGYPGWNEADGLELAATLDADLASDLLAFLQQHHDVVDGDDGQPMPNEAMKLSQRLEAALTTEGASAPMGEK